MRRSILIFISLYFSLGLSGQVITVLDPNLNPIEAATISNASNQNWITDKLGRAEVDITSAQRLVVQHVGFFAKEIWFEPGGNTRIILDPKVDQLSDVIVEGFTEEEALSRQAGSIAKIGPSEFSRFDQMSLVSAVNVIPGVRFEERAGASYRVSIRGSSIRSPFGVRNVKVYWNGIPFTEPGGNTFINLLDLSNVGDMQIIKGPAGSAYGAGNGGVMKINSTNLSKLANGLSFGLLGGSFGNFRTNLQSNWLSEKMSLTSKYAFQKSDGYRDHNEMTRMVGEVDFMYFQNEEITWSASALYSDLFYEIPGGLNPTQLEDNRRQARPGSENFNASIDHQYFLLRGGQQYEQSENFRSDINTYFYHREFENPFNLDYKRDAENSLGYRFELENDFQLLGRESSIAYGNELQMAYFEGKNFGNVGGQADTIRFSDKLQNRISFWFADAKLKLTESLKLTLGASLNRINYDINRLEDKINNSPGRVVKNFDRVFSPRLALSKVWSDNFSTHLSVSHGYTPPTTTEIRTNEGTLNLGLAPELGINYELNLRGAVLDKRLSYDVAMFVFNLD
ncbi:MAG TPA: TonB-dependent receptor, partial [Roseivirga sp.]